MITAIWGCGGVGKSAIACGLGNLYAAKGTAAVIDSNLCHPTLPQRLPGVRLEAERSLGRYLNRLGDSEVRRYYYQHPDNKGLFFAGLTDRNTYTDFEIGLENAERAREFLVRSEEMFDHVLLDCSVQRTDPFLPAMLRHATRIILPLLPGIGAVHWYNAVRPMLENAGVLKKLVPVATMVLPFYLPDEVERQLDTPFVARFRYSKELARRIDEGRLPDSLLEADGANWLKNLRLLAKALAQGDEELFMDDEMVVDAP